MSPSRRRVDYGALPEPLPGESLRRYAARAQTTVSAARVKIGEQRGISRAVATGHAARTGERGLAPSRRARSIAADLAGVESVKFRRYGTGKVAVIAKGDGGGDGGGGTSVTSYADADWDEFMDWYDDDYWNDEWDFEEYQ
jgi:hypothetical protein